MPDDDVFALSFQVWDATPSVAVQVEPTTLGNKTSVAVGGAGKLGRRHYVATWQTPSSPNLGRWFIRWFLTRASGDAVESWDQNIEMLASETQQRIPYGSLSGVRAEGLTVTQASDVRVLESLALAAREIEDYTGFTFGVPAELLTMRVDGRGTPDLLLPDPIVGVQDVRVLTHGTVTTTVSSELADIAVYSVVEDIDNAWNPKLSFFRATDYLGVHRSRVSEIVTPGFIFDFGQQNIEVDGVFGFTERLTASPQGDVPSAIERVANLLALRHALPRLSAERRDLLVGHRIVAESTEDQSYRLDTAGATYGPFTGDPEIDNVLLRYARGLAIGAA